MTKGLFGWGRRDRRPWLRVSLRLRGSVVPTIAPRVVLCGGFAGLISILHAFKIPVAHPEWSNVVPSLVLGLLLVFRTNTAYERFWEGRKLWGSITNTSRNLGRQIWVAVNEATPSIRDQKVMALKLIAAFAGATKQHLRSASVIEEVGDLVPADLRDRLAHTNHGPLEISVRLAAFLEDQRDRGNLTQYQLASLHHLLDSLVDSLGGCERILRTPMPFAYAIHLRQLLLLYCLILPFELVAKVGPWTAMLVTIISFTLFGIEEIGEEIENPFGTDPNDLPLDVICHTIRQNMQDLSAIDPRTVDARSLS
jgi:putative membrane protein